MAAPREAAAGEHQVQDSAGRRAERARREGSRASPVRRTTSGAADVSALAAAVEAGQVKALYVFDPGRRARSATRRGSLRRGRAASSALLIVQGVLHDAAARGGGLRPARHRCVEKDATYTNDDGRLQGGSRAITPPGDAQEDWQIFVNLGVALGVPWPTRRAGRPRATSPRALRGHRTVRGARRRWRSRGRCPPALAAGVEPVGALEVGLHVPGPAAGEVRRATVGPLPLPSDESIPARRREVTC